MKSVVFDEGENALQRILFVDHTASLGGAQLALLRLVRALDHRRFDIHAVLFSDGPLADKLRNAGAAVEILRLPEAITTTSRYAAAKSLLSIGTVLTILRHIVRLSQIIRIRKADLVHTNSLKSDLIGGFAALLARRPLIWHIHDRLSGDYMPLVIARVLWLLALILPNRVILNSQESLKTLRPYPATSCDVIFPGVDLADFSAVAIGQERSDGASAPLVGIVGRISPTKGHDIFLRAAALVHRRFPNVRFKIVGSAMFNDAAYEKEMRGLARSLGMSAFVEFVGFVDDIGHYLPRLSVLVQASTTPESFGQVIVEGMAARVPVVAVGTGGVPEIISAGLTGLLVPPADSWKMAAAICELLGNPREAQAMAERARERVEDHFSIHRTARMVENVYDKVLVTCRFTENPIKTVAVSLCPVEQPADS